MKPPSASNLLYTLGRKPTAIITEERLQKWNKAWTPSTPFTPTNLYFILVCVSVCVLCAGCQCFCIISLCFCLCELFTIYFLFRVWNSIRFSLNQRSDKNVYIVSNSNPKSLQTMNWNAMFHFLLFNTGFCNVIRTLGHKARMQQQPTVRKRKWKTHEKWELNSIGIGALATYITTHRGTMLCYSPFTLSTSWNELIHWSAVVTKFFEMVIINGSVECDEHKKKLGEKRK